MRKHIPAVVPRALLSSIAALLFSTSLNGGVNVLTYLFDNGRTGLNAQESVLTPANVRPATFGKLFTFPVDGQIFAQPLLLNDVSFGVLGTHNAIYVATEHDTLYAFDADSADGPNALPLWKVSFIEPEDGITPVPPTDTTTINLPAISKEIGITATPVIDPDTLTIYVEVMTKESGRYVHRLHALDAGSGTERPNSPVVVSGSVTGRGLGSVSGVLTFDPKWEMARSALTLVSPSGYPHKIVILAYGSLMDNGPTHGWTFSYDASTLQPMGVFCTTPSSSLGSFWMTGNGPAADSSGNLYGVTANGHYDNTVGDFGDSVIKLTADTFSLIDWFTPYNQAALAAGDVDLGSCGGMVLPDEAGNLLHPHLYANFGKEGRLYILDRDHLGGFNAGADSQIPQWAWTPSAGGPPTSSFYNYCSGAYFNGFIYFIPDSDVLRAFPIHQAVLGANATNLSTATHSYAVTPTISANGTNNGIIWAVDVYHPLTSAAVLRAHDATKPGPDLYNSATMGLRDLPGPGVKFTPPMIANGKVYVATATEVDVYGLGSWTGNPVVTPNGATFSNSVTVTISDPTVGASIYYTLDGSDPTPSSAKYTGPLVISHSASLHARAYAPGLIASPTVTANFQSTTAIGNGTGLLGQYWSNGVTHVGKNLIVQFTGSPTLERIDTNLNFYWTSSNPVDPTVGYEYFTARWDGSILAEATGTHTFSVLKSDGFRLWINGIELIDSWVNERPTQYTATMDLLEGQRYPIHIDYYDNSNYADLILSWSGPETTLVPIPESQLFPPVASSAPTISLTLAPTDAPLTEPATITLTAVAASAQSVIQRVEFLDSTGIIATVTTTPYSVTIPGLVAGVYTFTAQATDANGNQTESSAVSFNVVQATTTNAYGMESRPELSAYLGLPTDPDDLFPATLSQTGAFDNTAAFTLTAGLIPYTPAAPFWSDGAVKERWMGVPYDGDLDSAENQISYSQDGNWDFPVGSVFVKHFSFVTNEVDSTAPLRRLETRLLVYAGKGSVYGATYKWRPDGSDADLLTSSQTENLQITTATGVRTQQWYYPSPTDCLVCHNLPAGGLLGASKTRQLNTSITYPSTGITDNQIRTLNHLGILNPALAESTISNLPSYAAATNTATSLELRARSFLDVNCGYCHQPGGTGHGSFDLRITTPLTNANLINDPVVANFGLPGAAAIVPGNVASSVIYYRVAATDPLGKMPPLARSTVDTKDLAVLGQWIDSLAPAGGNAAPQLSIIAPQSTSETTYFSVTNTAEESDPDGMVTYALITSPTGATISTNGVIAWTPMQSQSPGTYRFTTEATSSDPFDLVNPVLKSTNSFTVTVNEINIAPLFQTIPTQTINAGVSLLVTNTATDANIHSTISYTLLNPPAGMIINGSGAISWTPASFQGPSTNIITTIAISTDAFDSIHPTLAATNSFTVIVSAPIEVNALPILPAIQAQSVKVGSLLTVNDAASQAPCKGVLSYALLQLPTGMTIDHSGVITWTPTQLQAANQYQVTAVVTSNDPLDLIHPILKATNTFNVTALEVNYPPFLPPVSTLTINELSLLIVTNTATDLSIHGNISYSLPSKPTGMAISHSGIITWVPSQYQSPSTNTVVVVAISSDSHDLLNPTLTTTNTFNVIVTEINTPPVLTPVPPQTVRQSASIIINNSATVQNYHSILSYALANPPIGAMIQSNGTIVFTPNSSQAGHSYTITTYATSTDLFDAVNPILQATNSFNVTVGF